MSEYLVSVFVICALVGVCSRISYGRGADIGKFSFAVAVAFVILSPIADYARNFDLDGLFDEITSGSDYDAGYTEVAADAFERGIESAVCEKFSLQEDCVRAVASGFDFSEMRAEQIKIYLSGRGVLTDASAVKKYISGFELGECDVEFEIGR